MLSLLLAACGVDNDLNPKDTGRPAFDTADSGPFVVDTDETAETAETAPPPEECNGVDDDGDALIDEDFPDDDANGRADCLDLTCPPLGLGSAGHVDLVCGAEATPPSEVTDDPWAAETFWRFETLAESADTNNSAQAPVIGNLDDDNGDGVVNEDDIPDVILPAVGGPQYLVAVDGATGAEKWAVTASYKGQPLIADVNADGLPDIVAADDAGHTLALNGADGSVIWTSTASAATRSFFMIAVADLDMDGQPEVIDNEEVLDGATGALLWEMPVSRTVCEYTAPTAADVDQRDDDQEVVWCGNLYDSDGTLLWESGEDGSESLFPFLVQADADGEAEIGFVGGTLSLWEADGTRIMGEAYTTSYPQAGPPAVGDFDGDGAAEVAFASYETVYMYELDGTLDWTATVDDKSGLAGVSGFDLNADGALEVLYADQVSFRILDGATGATLFTDATHTSGTLFEFPTVADLDHDGHAEIVYAGQRYGETGGLLEAVHHSGSGWAPAGPTWHAHDYAVSNVNADGSIPARPVASWLHTNTFRARAAVDPTALADLAVTITDLCMMDCTYGPAALAVTVDNRGGRDVVAGMELTVYAQMSTGDELVATVTLPAVPTETTLDGIEVTVPFDHIADLGYRVVVDEAGGVLECDETNNEAIWADSTCL